MEKLMKLKYSLLLLLAVVLLLGTTSCNHAMYRESNGFVCTSHFRYDIAKQDSSYFVVVQSKSELSRREFTDSTRMELTLPNDSIYIFDGKCVAKNNGFYLVVGITPVFIIPIPLQYRYSKAVFPIHESTLKLFENGISGAGITMTRRNHWKFFKNDKFGKALYKQYQKLKDN